MIGTSPADDENGNLVKARIRKPVWFKLEGVSLEISKTIDITFRPNGHLHHGHSTKDFYF